MTMKGVMAWVEKRQPTVFEQMEIPIQGLFFWDGDVLATVFGRDGTKGMKYAMLSFPSGREFALWESNSERGGLVHLFGEMDLLLFSTRDEAFERANDIAEQVGYLARKQGEDGLEVAGQDTHEHYLITYDDAQRKMVDVQRLWERVPRPLRPLLDEASRARLPKLGSGEKLGMGALAQVKFFTPDAHWTWYASEFDGEDTFFGLVIGDFIEFGSFSLSELADVRGGFGLPIERDKFFEPTPLGVLKQKHERERYE
jgi:hypothetical protein